MPKIHNVAASASASTFGGDLKTVSSLPTFVIFDLDGVLRRWPTDDGLVESKFGLRAGILRELAFEPELLALALTGMISDAEWRARIANNLASVSALPQSIATNAVMKWSESIGAVNVEVLAIVRRARKISKVALFTNATQRVVGDLQKLSLLIEVDEVIYSGALGSFKPHPEAFAAALKVLNANAQDVLFIDDTSRNVDGATSCGIVSHRYTSPTALEAFLKERRVL